MSSSRTMTRLSLGCCIVGWTLCGGVAGGEVWKQAAAVEQVMVRVHWVSVAELEAVARALGKRPAGEPLGFSVLRQNVATKTYVCDVFLPLRPVRVDDRATRSLGHEMAHCFGFAH